MKRLRSLEYIGEWYIIKVGGIYYAEREVMYRTSTKKFKQRFKGWNGHDLSLSGEKEWAQSWVNTRNSIEKII